MLKWRLPKQANSPSYCKVRSQWAV
jgi:hypothetical protein